MGVGAGLYMYVVVVQKFTFAISSPDEFLYVSQTGGQILGRQWSRRDVDFFIPRQRMFVEFKMFWLQKESVVT